jgi:hypothetical protein
MCDENNVSFLATDARRVTIASQGSSLHINVFVRKSSHEASSTGCLPLKVNQNLRLPPTRGV